MSVKPKQEDSLSSNVVVDGVKGCRNIEEVQTSDLLMRDGRNKFIVQKVGRVSVEYPLTKPDWCGLTSELVSQVAIDTGSDNAFS